MTANVRALPTARATHKRSRAVSAVPVSVANAVEQFMADHGVTQITAMPEFRSGDMLIAPPQYSLVIGNNRYFGETIADALEGPAQ